MNVYMKDNFCTIYKLKFHQLQRFLEANGLQPVDDLNAADVVISGVCAAFDADEARAISIMKRNAKRHVPHYTIGCLVGVNPDALVTDYSYRTWEFARLARDLTGVDDPNYDDAPLPSLFRSREDYRIFDGTRRFVGVTTGCGFECSYCPHKVGAGGVSSRPVEVVVADVGTAISEGARIIHLTGLDTASYGRETGENFGRLLTSVLASAGQEVVFHIAQFNPEGLGAGEDFELLLRACSDSRVVDIQLPIQTASKRLLQLMNRDYELSAVQSFVERLRAANPDVFLRTDVMIGFPSETLSDVDETIRLTAKLFNEAAIYVYERKEGTPVADVPPDWEIPSTEKKRRLKLVSEQLKVSGVLIHSGGQKLSSLLDADKAKAGMDSPRCQLQEGDQDRATD
jgi:tRNA A37 methylthiotransferase MiaB